MQGFGFILVFVAVVAALVGFLQFRKGKKILAAPFKRTGEIAANPGVADAKGLVSCEGAVEVQQPVLAPCSGTPCVYYEIDVIQEWDKHVKTENGHKVERGTTKVATVKNGGIFFLNDGSGPVAIDPRQGLDVELDKTFEQGQSVTYGDVIFGQFQTQVPRAGGDKNGRGVKVIEKIVPVQGSMFVKGQLTDRVIGKPKGLLGSLHGSRKGRAALLGATKRNSTIGFVAAGVCFVPGLALAIFADPPPPPVPGEDACNILDESKADKPCTGKIVSDDGANATLTVTKAGTFEIHGGPPAGKKIPLIPSISVKSEAGASLLKDASEIGTVDLQPGKYVVTIKDSIPGEAAGVQGGFSFELSVKRTAVAAEAHVTAASASHASPSPPVDKGGKVVAGSNPAKGVHPAGGAPPSTATAAPVGDGHGAKPSASADPHGPKPSASTAKK